MKVPSPLFTTEPLLGPLNTAALAGSTEPSTSVSLAATSTVTEVSSRVAPESSLATGSSLTEVTVRDTIAESVAPSLSAME